MARTAQPGIIIADRTVHGPYENYQTPERRIPDTKMDDPWESCLPLGDNWGYVPNDNLKSTRTVIHNLVEVVAKGGNLLLGIGPQSDGTFPTEVEQRLQKIGGWLSKNGEAIYGTRAPAIFQDGNTYFTSREDKTYAIHLLQAGVPMPEQISWKGNVPKKGSTVKLLAIDKALEWEVKDGSVQVTLPKEVWSKEVPAFALSFSH